MGIIARKLIYGPRIVTNGLVLYLDAANPASYSGSGTVWNDVSGSGNTGTLINGPTYSDLGRGSIGFDVINDYVTTLLTTTSVDNHTQSFWYKWDGFTQFKPLIYLGDTGSNGMGLLIHNGSTFNSGNRVGLLYGGSAYNIFPSSIALTTNWTQFTITRDTLTTSLYQNAVLFASSTSSPLTSSSYSFNYGSSVGGIGGGGGNISNISFYNRALSTEEVVQNYNAIRGRFEI